MKADQVTDKTIEILNTGNYTFGRINLANGDIVGHTVIMLLQKLQRNRRSLSRQVNSCN